MRRSVFTLTLIAAALGLTACGKKEEAPVAAPAAPVAAPAPAPAILVGLAIPETHVERWVGDAEYMKKDLEAMGYKVDVAFADADQSKQNKQIEDMVTKGAKAIVVGSVTEAAAQAVESAKAAGVPVISYDRLITGTDAYDYYLTFDNFKVGQLQGEAIKAGLALDTAKGKNITLFAGSPTDNNARFFFDGAMDVLKPFVTSGALKICGPAPTNSADATWSKITTEGWAADKAKARMETLLSGACKSVKLDAVLAPNDTLARSIIGALEQDGKYKTLPIITGQDGELLSAKWIMEGKQTMTVFKDTRVLAKGTAEAVDSIIKGTAPALTVKARTDTTTYNTGKKVVTSFLLEPVAVTKDNLTKELVDSGFYTAEAVAKGTK
ncbi:sugar-binding protein [Rhodoferax sp. 4810]|nr:sugar-binding protein [Rhodoferax jenense]